jgi:hypothetical protein
MRWTVSSQQREFFQRTQLIEFDALLTEPQTSMLAENCKKKLGHRLGIEPNDLKKKTPEEIFINGRDLSRTDPLIRKEVSHQQLARIAAELTEQSSLRLAYDQLISSTHFLSYSNTPKSPFNELVRNKLPLLEFSSLQGLLCGLILCLSKENPPSEKSDNPPLPVEEKPLSIFPAKPGNGVFFHPSFPISFDGLYGQENALYMIIAYSHPRTVYVHQPHDPHTHFLKTLGYVFGDKLVEKFHPTVYRC